MIKSVKLKNFQSWQELEFEIPKGICLVKGFNHDDQTAEGSGKSAILNAICWGLFGQIPKDTNVDDIITEGEKHCEVSVVLHDDTMVQRTRRPNDLILYKKYAMPLRGKDAKETQKLIEKHIGFTYETFLQSVYFAQNSLVKFLLLNEDGKGKILSQIADLSIFDEGRRKAHDKAREALLRLSMEKSHLADHVNSIKLVSDQINALRDVRTKFEAERVKNIGILELKRDDAQRQIDNLGYIPELSADYYMKLSELKATVQKYRDETARLKAEITQQSQRQLRKNGLELEIKQAKEDIERATLDKGHSCDTCGSVLGHEEQQRYVQTKAAYIQQKTKELQGLDFTPTEKLQDEYKFYADTTRQIEEDLKGVQVLELEVKHKKEKLSMLTAQLTQINKDLDAQKNKEYPDIDKRIELLQTSLFQREHDRDILAQKVKDLADINNRYEIIKEGFKEVKSLAFQEVLEELNNKTNGYLADLMAGSTTLKFSNLSQDGDVSKIITTLTIDGIDRQLGLFSGGQTRRIMLAVDLAISDIIHSRKGITNKLLILDEYFKDLSEESIAKVCSLLSSINANVIMIEHNSMLNSLATNVFEIEYKNGISSVKNQD